MRRFRPLIILALFLLHSLGFAHEAAGEWRCEGRTCSATFLYCCCQTAPDGRSAAPLGLNDFESSPCSAECSCEFVEDSDCAHRAVSPSASVCFATAPEPLPLTLYAPPSTDLLIRHTKTRGPPASTPSLATPSLRAPPSA